LVPAIIVQSGPHTCRSICRGRARVIDSVVLGIVVFGK
jgi:hypothetical protein